MGRSIWGLASRGGGGVVGSRFESACVVGVDRGAGVERELRVAFEWRFYCEGCFFGQGWLSHKGRLLPQSPIGRRIIFNKMTASAVVCVEVRIAGDCHGHQVTGSSVMSREELMVSGVVFFVRDVSFGYVIHLAVGSSVLMSRGRGST